MVDLVLKRSGQGLIAADEEASEALAKIPDDTVVMADVRQPRNIGHHRKFFRLMRVVADNVGMDPEALRSVILVEVGHCHIVKRANGDIERYPKSINFASVDQTRFNEIWEAAVKFIVTEILPGIDRKALENEVLELVA